MVEWILNTLVSIHCFRQWKILGNFLLSIVMLIQFSDMKEMFIYKMQADMSLK